MGSINIFKPLSTFLKPELLINLSNIENFSSEFFWERCKSNPGLLGEKQVCYLYAMQPFNPPPLSGDSLEGRLELAMEGLRPFIQEDSCLSST